MLVLSVYLPAFLSVTHRILSRREVHDKLPEIGRLVSTMHHFASSRWMFGTQSDKRRFTVTFYSVLRGPDL